MEAKITKDYNDMEKILTEFNAIFKKIQNLYEESTKTVSHQNRYNLMQVKINKDRYKNKIEFSTTKKI